MVDPRTIARLADIHEFAELKKLFDERREADIQALARKTFSQPAEHDQLAWERKKAFYAGVDAVFALPEKERDSLRKESQ